jgi:hypothetical protein
MSTRVNTQLSKTIRDLRLYNSCKGVSLSDSYMDPGTRHLAPGSKTKDNLLLTVVE